MKENKELRNRYNDLFDVTAPGTVSLIGNMLGETLFGTIFPGIAVIGFSYKQKRFERNMVRAFQEIKNSEALINERLARLENIENFRQKLEVIFDYVFDEPQEEKIEYIINGLITLSEYENADSNFALTYYDLLQSLRIADILYLKNCYIRSSYEHLAKQNQSIIELNLNYEQESIIKTKLVSMGLLETDEVYQLQEYVERLASSPPTRTPTAPHSTSYHISQLGISFIDFFLASK